MDSNEPVTLGERTKREASELFDVCHVGVVLRVVLCVQIVMLLALSFQSSDALDLFSRWSQTTVGTLPASLLWLVLACAARAPLRPARESIQWLFAVTLGGLCALMAHVELAWLAQTLSGQPMHWGWPQFPAVFTGALMGGMCMAWLKHRTSSVVPAHAAARLAELQARIRPHFLFNTLNTAIALVQVDPPKAEGVLEDLAELFRQALSAPQSCTTLGDEISLSRRYLSIEQLRFGDRMRVDWRVDPEAMRATVPPLILQPLVENAVRHGVEPSAEGGWISIQALMQGEQVMLSVRNSVPQQVALPFSAGHGMALQNVRQRLQLMYDVQAEWVTGLKTSDIPDEPAYFEVKLKIPMTDERAA